VEFQSSECRLQGSRERRSLDLPITKFAGRVKSYRILAEKPVGTMRKKYRYIGDNSHQISDDKYRMGGIYWWNLELIPGID
jgi:hypothetical protein